MNLAQFAATLRNGDAIVFFTGAGISTESGVPDFRSPGGIWTRYKPVYYADFLTSHEARVRYWQMKKETYEVYKKVQPNIGHYSIQKFEVRGQLLGLITQNIDGLHRLAGVSEEKIVELHGNDRAVKCVNCEKGVNGQRIYENLSFPIVPPTCDACGGWLKPATISFGQPMPAPAMAQAAEWSQQAKVFIVIGSSLQVQPAASFPALAKQNGAFLAVINRDPTPLDELAGFSYRGEIGDFFRTLNPLLADA